MRLCVAIDERRCLRLLRRILKWVLWWSRRLEGLALWTMHLSRHAWLALTVRLLLLRRHKARTSLSSAAGHDTLEEVGWSMSNCWRWWLRRSSTRSLHRTASRF